MVAPKPSGHEVVVAGYSAVVHDNDPSGVEARFGSGGLTSGVTQHGCADSDSGFSRRYWARPRPTVRAGRR